MCPTTDDLLYGQKHVSTILLHQAVAQYRTMGNIFPLPGDSLLLTSLPCASLIGPMLGPKLTCTS